MRLSDVKGTLCQLTLILFILGKHVGRMVNRFERGSGCGIAKEIVSLKRPWRVGDPLGCSLVSFPATAEYLSTSKGELSQRAVQEEIFGGWSEWSLWTGCTTTCGSGQKQRNRQCKSSKPEMFCEGPAVSIRYCNIMYCPVHGIWSQWNEWDSCATDCFKFKELRDRTCDDPPPKHKGSPCSGLVKEERNCTEEAVCPGQWTTWSLWTSCISPTDSCGFDSGNRERERTCTNPSPRNGGADCPGNKDQEETCYIPCPIPGGWSQWTNWDPCSTLCGLGIHNRTRECNNPVPQFKGDPCPEADPEDESRSCDVDCKAGTQEVGSNGVGDFNGWKHCPNTFHVVNYATKAQNDVGIFAMVLVCNDPGRTKLISYSGGSPLDLGTSLDDCPSGYTKAKSFIEPDGGAFKDDLAQTCMELFCPDTNSWQRSACYGLSGTVTERTCPGDQVICGVNVANYCHWTDDVGVTRYAIECCERP